MYEFENNKDDEKTINYKNLEILTKKFDHKWDNRVKKTRRLTELIQIICKIFVKFDWIFQLSFYLGLLHIKTLLDH